VNRDERFEINSSGSLVVGIPVTLTPSEKKSRIEQLFSINGWEYTLLNEITSAHYYIELKNDNLKIVKRFHLFHGNVRKEDPERNREEKKIQLGTENDPRDYFEDALILGFYVFENKELLSDTVIVAWPIEEGKNYPANPSLRVNMRTDIMPAKNAGYYVDRTTGKNLVAFRPEFIYHYIENYKNLHYGIIDKTTSSEVEKYELNNSIEENRNDSGENILLYGVPGSGKSWTIEHEYCDDEDCMERLVFHPDYMYSDFVGQILPIVKNDQEGKEKVRYEFTPGPFTKILKKAYLNPSKSYYLIIEEINRGNAPAIFGEIFQLLDRQTEDSEAYKKGTSEYGITNDNIAYEVYGDSEKKVRIPANLSIIGTMNTSDQNVFTLDTAFQRRWIMRMIPNSFINHKFAGDKILDTEVSWQQFCDAINEEILRRNNVTSSEDKRLGAYFVSADDLDLKIETDNANEKEKIEVIHKNARFAEKVLKYLWDDAFKFSHADTFDTRKYKSLEMVIDAFNSTNGNDRFKVFHENLRKLIIEGVDESNVVSESEED
jgi:hypothetical protein